MDYTSTVLEDGTEIFYPTKDGTRVMCRIELDIFNVTLPPLDVLYWDEDMRDWIQISKRQ